MKEGRNEGSGRKGFGWKEEKIWKEERKGGYDMKGMKERRRGGRREGRKQGREE